MSAAQIYSQYISDYEDAAKKYNRSARAYQNTTDYYGGPIRGQTQSGETLGLYRTPGTERQIVKQGTADDYQKAYQAANEEQRQAFGQYTEANDSTGNPTGSGTWTVREGQDGNAIHSFGGWSFGGGQSGEGYYKDVGNGLAAMRTNGKPTGKYITERIGGDKYRADELARSGRYKDVRFVPGQSGTDEYGNSFSDDYIDVTYEEMAFPDQPGEFKAKKPSLSMAQLREIANPTPTMAEAEREGVNDVGLIESARNKFMSAKPGLISSSR